MTHEIANTDGEVMEILTIEEIDEKAHETRAHEGELEFQIGKERYRNNDQDEAIQKEGVRARLVENDLQTRAALESVRVDAAIQQEQFRARTVEDDIETRAALEKARNDRQDAMFSKQVPYGTVAAGTDAEKSVVIVPGPCRLSKLLLVNGAALAADGTNNTKLELINRGADGLGTTVLATFDSATEAFVAFDGVVKTISGSVDLAAEDVLSLKKTDTGTGAAVTELLVAVSCSPIP